MLTYFGSLGTESSSRRQGGRRKRASSFEAAIGPAHHIDDYAATQNALAASRSRIATLM
jgi:hypothetical protein